MLFSWFKTIYISTSVPSGNFVLFQALFVWLYFFIIIKCEPLVGETLIEIKSAVTKQAEKVWFCFFQNILTVIIFYHCQMDI